MKVDAMLCVPVDGSSSDFLAVTSSGCHSHYVAYLVGHDVSLGGSPRRHSHSSRRGVLPQVGAAFVSHLVCKTAGCLHKLDVAW